MRYSSHQTAMKFLPRRYREGQLDWFAKRGINWHVSVSLVKLEHELKTITHVHIFNTQASQDASTTTAVLTDVVQDLRTILPNLQKVHLFSDNAICYKSSLTLSTLRHDIGPTLATYNFSESQNGKGNLFCNYVSPLPVGEIVFVLSVSQSICLSVTKSCKHFSSSPPI